jgi:hypothetical protein
MRSALAAPPQEGGDTTSIAVGLSSGPSNRSSRSSSSDDVDDDGGEDDDGGRRSVSSRTTVPVSNVVAVAVAAVAVTPGSRAQGSTKIGADSNSSIRSRPPPTGDARPRLPRAALFRREEETMREWLRDVEAEIRHLLEQDEAEAQETNEVERAVTADRLLRARAVRDRLTGILEFRERATKYEPDTRSEER